MKTWVLIVLGLGASVVRHIWVRKTVWCELEKRGVAVASSSLLDSVSDAYLTRGGRQLREQLGALQHREQNMWALAKALRWLARYGYLEASIYTGSLLWVCFVAVCVYFGKKAIDVLLHTFIPRMRSKRARLQTVDLDTMCQVGPNILPVREVTLDMFEIPDTTAGLRKELEHANLLVGAIERRIALVDAEGGDLADLMVERDERLEVVGNLTQELVDIRANDRLNQRERYGVLEGLALVWAMTNEIRSQYQCYGNDGIAQRKLLIRAISAYADTHPNLPILLRAKLLALVPTLAMMPTTDDVVASHLAYEEQFIVLHQGVRDGPVLSIRDMWYRWWYGLEPVPQPRR